MSFTQALSGLNAQQEKLGVVGNNIANSQTVGFKSSNVQFADVFANSRVGLGVRTSAVLQNFSQGNIESTSRNMDLAIAGEGFFRYQQPNGEIGYSRNGQLTMTSDGRLVNAQGAQIMGYPADAEGNVQEGGNVVPMEIPPGDLPANATTGLDISLNLNSGQPVIAAAFDADNANTYNYSTNATVFDSQGNARNLSVYFTKTAANEWEVNGRLSGGPADGGTYDVALGNLTFTQNGTLQADNSTNALFNNNEFGAGNPLAALDIELSFEGSTQFASESTVNDTVQDGYTSGALVGITIEEDGTIMRNYSNEESRAAGQVTLVTFRNPEGLRPEGENLWAATGTSGQELLGAPGAGLRGLIQPSAIETSNVDMARELVDMIVAQRAYQANSQTISTQDELLQTIINI
ncbi:flagellar hook protein FlgE [Halomonas sp. CnH100-B]|uniref:Flagellar hook protein FlgE n=1 Tax=Vreelandella aquamarina TaxID=77097 RepID=A0A857GMN2_9GAMM|nr:MULTISPECIES: flagellar hook protein FlgE [Halomonas]MAO61860.1 flagellar hook protein FlgE [Halomonas sp.]MCO7230744.1 flagellar hook protein FlgE [Halomonas sp. CnH100-B]MDK9688515.1 flagellar hook protein FlgE [Halomonas sp. LC1]MDP4559239.1 flagellar hook protein FlgE [Halomonas meridiana]QHD48261.1 flagellar hook protein FlgE [Halomonas meridiana]|tara:strand:+ start:1209 stop:2426 length:1218 start_codon:yes stop_codon:yes gene_type:complete